MKIKKGNQVGEVKSRKGISSLDELAGIGKESFKTLGGGEAFLKNERKDWQRHLCTCTDFASIFGLRKPFLF